MARGDYDKAFEVFSGMVYEDERLAYQAWALHAAGDLQGFERLKNEFSEEHGSPWHMARLYGLEGDTEAAVASLQLTFCGVHEGCLGLRLRDPRFESLHGEPGWEELRERAGLSEAQIAGTKLNLPDGI